MSYSNYIIPIFKMKFFIYTLILTALLTACSSKFDPDIAFKGEIDDNFLTALSRGEASVTFEHDFGSCFFYKSYIDGKAVGEWKELNTDGLLGFSTSFYKQIVIADGYTWNCYDIDINGDIYEQMVDGAWNYYKEENGLSHNEYVKCRFEYNPSEKAVKIYGSVYEVESASDDKLVISCETPSYHYNDKGEWVIFQIQKGIYTLRKKDGLPIDFENSLMFDSRKDVILARLAVLREHYGDVFVYDDPYLTYSHINLCLLEDIISEKKDHKDIPYDNILW